MPRTPTNTAEQLFPSRMEGAPALATIICQLVGYTVERLNATYSQLLPIIAEIGLGLPTASVFSIELNEYGARSDRAPRAILTTQASLRLATPVPKSDAQCKIVLHRRASVAHTNRRVPRYALSVHGTNHAEDPESATKVCHRA
jgi:hypothetical protein